MAKKPKGKKGRKDSTKSQEGRKKSDAKEEIKPPKIEAPKLEESILDNEENLWITMRTKDKARQVEMAFNFIPVPTDEEICTCK